MEIARLRQWFLKNKRDLPWRHNPTPYQVWVSEVMLQQTQVRVVIDYYLKWMQLFPTIEALAEASLDQVIKVWEGLGYYSRARRLHEAAKTLTEHYAGKLPTKEEELLKMQGLGLYTANAILSFAYHQKKAAVDGNVVRVMTRYYGVAEDVSQPKVIQSLRAKLQSTLPDEEPWVVMEGLIELGALVCKKKPQCSECPLRFSCIAYEEQNPERYPIKKEKGKVIELRRRVLVIESEGYVLMRQEKEERKIMAHLWEFPYSSLENLSQKALPQSFRVHFTNEPRLLQELSTVVHRFTKYQAYLYPSLWSAEERPLIAGYEWIEKQKLSEYPFSSGHRKILYQLQNEVVKDPRCL
jgi:A/G-specific adenine glycosylase